MPQRFAPLIDTLEKLFTTPSLMKGEDPRVYAELHALVEEVAQPKDVWDQSRNALRHGPSGPL